jgi:hypothetical protein
VVSFTPRPLYPQGRSPQYALDRRPGGPKSWSGHGCEEKNSQPCQELNPDCPAHSLVAIPAELSWLPAYVVTHEKQCDELGRMWKDY